MKAVRIHEFGGADVLRFEEVPEPVLGEDEALILVRAASVNPVDYKIREGGYPAVKQSQLPIILGRDVSGVVAKVGASARGLKPGDEVFAMVPQDRGGYAEQVTAPARLCARKPRSLDFVQAA